MLHQSKEKLIELFQATYIEGERGSELFNFFLEMATDHDEKFSEDFLRGAIAVSEWLVAIIDGAVSPEEIAGLPEISRAICHVFVRRLLIERSHQDGEGVFR